MNKLFSAIRFFLRLSGKERINLLRIILILTKVYIIVKLFPLRFYYERFFSQSRCETIDLQPFKHQIDLIKLASIYLPFNITCLMQSMAIKLYLEKYNVLAPICLGIKNKQTLSAHAWILDTDSNGYNRNILR